MALAIVGEGGRGSYAHESAATMAKGRQLDDEGVREGKDEEHEEEEEAVGQLGCWGGCSTHAAHENKKWTLTQASDL